MATVSGSHRYNCRIQMILLKDVLGNILQHADTILRLEVTGPVLQPI